jgi:hypothetical protein
VPVRSEAPVVCDVIVEIAEVTVPIGSRGWAPAIAALLTIPPSARATKHRARMAVDPIQLRVPAFGAGKLVLAEVSDRQARKDFSSANKLARIQGHGFSSLSSVRSSR